VHCVFVIDAPCTDVQVHGTTKLVPYFTVLNYCLVSRTEKLMVCDTFLLFYHDFVAHFVIWSYVVKPTEFAPRLIDIVL